MEKRKIFACIFGVCVVVGISAFLIPRHTKDDEDENGSSGKHLLLDFLPKPDQVQNPGSKLIWINRQNEQNESYWADEIGSFVQKYKNTSIGNGAKCRFENGRRAASDSYCIVDVTNMKGCIETSQDKYGYTHGISKPCVLIKFNKIYEWIPQPYRTEKELEESEKRKMPKDLQDRIRALLSESATQLTKTQLETMWVSCEGESPADKENIGPLKFFAPGFEEDFPGIPTYYFPYLNQTGYQEPFVFVRFENPQLNVLIRVKCKAWALNVIDGDKQILGSVQFELLLD